MKRWSCNEFLGFAAASCVGILLASSPTFAQNPPDNLPDNDGRTAAQNVNRQGFGRRPGRLVAEGIIAANRVGRNFSQGVDVDEVAEGPIEALLVADAIDIVFEQIVQAITLFENLLRARAGLPPSGLATLTTPNATNGNNSLTDLASLLTGR